MKKGVILRVDYQTAIHLRVGKIGLPEGVRIAQLAESADRNCWVVRLEGDGLPDGAKTPQGDLYGVATIEIGPDGNVTRINV